MVFGISGSPVEDSNTGLLVKTINELYRSRGRRIKLLDIK